MTQYTEYSPPNGTDDEVHSPSRPQQFTCAGLFAGIGGFCVGFERAGFRTSWVLDISAEAAATYTKNFQIPNYLVRDINQTKATDLPEVDVLHAGFPCQSFSSAGLRMGFEDPRGQLLFNIPRLLEEWGNARPRVLVMENSPYLKIGEGGAWLKRVVTAIQRAGYWFSEKNCFELDAQEHGGLPQRRKRLFMVAVRNDRFDYNGIDLSKVPKTERLGLADVIKKKPVEEKYYLPKENRYNRMISEEAISEDPYQLYQLRKYMVRVPEPGVCPTLTANMGLGGHNVPFVRDKERIRKLTEWECLALQGFPENFDFPEFISKGSRYMLIGNAVSPAVSQHVAAHAIKFLKENA
jgi:DNA (cytosine-5)-methyltransferase 1